MARYPSSTKELDDAERDWWSDNGDLEEQFCWVQQPRQQGMVRRDYLHEVLRRIPSGSRVLELGCGTGWLTLLLAEAGIADLVGADFSASQITRARTAASRRGLGNRLEFIVAGGHDGGLAERGAFDVVIMHAFLHHLTTEEVTESLAAAQARLVPGGRLVLLEPVHFTGGPTRSPATLRVLRRIEALPRVLLRRGLRRATAAERGVRQRLGARATGVPPFGPSPKEVPFEPSELEDLLEEDFTIEVSQPVLSMAHLVAQELLVSSLSQPRLWGVLEWPLLKLACFLDRRFVARPDLPSTVWVFVLYVCTKRAR